MRWRGSPLCAQKPSAIFSATSTEVEPLSEKNTRVSSGGRISVRPRATSSAGSCVQPAKISWSICPACSRIASTMRGWQWPCVVTHQLDTASITRRPSAV
jgi:hypothetical protein